MVTTVLPVKRGISSPVVTNIPDKWSQQWFRYFIDNFLSNADIRNATTSSGVNINTGGSINQPPSLSLAVFTATTLGAAPASGGGTVNFLRADGTWATPAGSAAIPTNTVLGNVSGGTAAPTAVDQTHLTALINVFTSTLSGAVPLSGGGTTNFLRADGNWAVPVVPLSANPSAQVGLTAVNGTALTFMTSDSAPALSQAIVPTWSGVHTFSARPAFNLGATVSGGTFVTRGFSDLSTVGNTLTISSAGNVTVTTPASGVALSVSGTTSAIALTVSSNLGAATGGADIQVNRAGSTINSVAEGPNLFLVDGAAAIGYYLQTSGGQFELWSSVGASPVFNQILKVTTNRGLVVNTPSAGQALVLSGVANSFTSVFTGSSTAGQSFGSRINAGTNSSDAGFEVQNASAATLYLRVRGDGETFVAPNGVLINTLATLTNNAGANTGTLTNAPAAGNPTKWIKINDNGTTRSIPAW